jgi:uncharacterized protein YjbI with pentapeptide repeats
MKFILVLTSLALTQACMTQSSEESSNLASLTYTYDSATGKCLDAEGNEGLNEISESIVPGMNGECGDFRDRDLSGAVLDNGNFRGADFSGAFFNFTKGMAMDLSGATITGTEGGYNKLSNFIFDQFTSIAWRCSQQEDGLMSCSK